MSIRRAWPSAVVATFTAAVLPFTSMPRISIAGRLTPSAAAVSCLAQSAPPARFRAAAVKSRSHTSE